MMITRRRGGGGKRSGIRRIERGCARVGLGFFFHFAFRVGEGRRAGVRYGVKPARRIRAEETYDETTRAGYSNPAEKDDGVLLF